MDKYRLQYEMKSRGVTVTALCSVLSISRSSFYRKCNGISEFTQREIQQMVGYLDLKSPTEIFFPEKVSEKIPDGTHSAAMAPCQR